MENKKSYTTTTIAIEKKEKNSKRMKKYFIRNWINSFSYYNCTIEMYEIQENIKQNDVKHFFHQILSLVLRINFFLSAVHRTLLLRVFVSL